MLSQAKLEVQSLQKERILYLALKQIRLSYLALENLNFLIWHQDDFLP